MTLCAPWPLLVSLAHAFWFQLAAGAAGSAVVQRHARRALAVPARGRKIFQDKGTDFS